MSDKYKKMSDREFRQFLEDQRNIRYDKFWNAQKKFDQEKKKTDLYKKCRECKYYEILQEPGTGELIGHRCVIYPGCIYKEETINV